jgi:hypothetical protein
MEKERKSPQQKKELEYGKDHFTFGYDSSRMFPRTWKRKKAHANRVYRRKSDELLVKAKPEISSEDAELIVGDITTAHLKQSVIRKRLQKNSTVTVREKIRINLEDREASIGRAPRNRSRYDKIATDAVATLASLEGEGLIDAARRAGLLRGTKDHAVLRKMEHSDTPIDRALHFVNRVTSHPCDERDALLQKQRTMQGF